MVLKDCRLFDRTIACLCSLDRLVTGFHILKIVITIVIIIFITIVINMCSYSLLTRSSRGDLSVTNPKG